MELLRLPLRGLGVGAGWAKGRYRLEEESFAGPLAGVVLVPWTVRDSPPPPHARFLSSLRARLMLLHPSPNCSLRAESLVHVHFKEEIGVAELIPLVTTYIILFAYIYFSTRRSCLAGLIPGLSGAQGSAGSSAKGPVSLGWDVRAVLSFGETCHNRDTPSSSSRAVGGSGTCP